MTTPRPVRYRCMLEAHLVIDHHPVPVTVLELSEGGAFVLERHPVELEVGTRATLRLPLPGGEAWEAGIIVTRHGTSRAELSHPRVQHLTVACSGAGVEFAPMSEAALERLREFLELLDER